MALERLFDGLMGPSWPWNGAMLAILGVKLAFLGAGLAVLGANLAVLGANLVVLGANLAILAANLAILGANVAVLGANLAALGANLHDSQQLAKTLIFHWFLQVFRKVEASPGRQVGPGTAFGEHFGRQVGPGTAFWEHLGRQVGPGTEFWEPDGVLVALERRFRSQKTSPSSARPEAPRGIFCIYIYIYIYYIHR